MTRDPPRNKTSIVVEKLSWTMKSSFVYYLNFERAVITWHFDSWQLYKWRQKNIKLKEKLKNMLENEKRKGIFSYTAISKVNHHSLIQQVHNLHEASVMLKYLTPHGTAVFLNRALAPKSLVLCTLFLKIAQRQFLESERWYQPGIMGTLKPVFQSTMFDF